MLPRRRRLERKVFDRVYREGVTLTSALIMVKAIKTSGDKGRFSVAVTSKAAKAAVERNRLRRQGYAILESTPLPEGLQAIFFIRKKGSREAMEEQMEYLLKKII